jgi:hypothetical protein
MNRKLFLPVCRIVAAALAGAAAQLLIATLVLKGDSWTLGGQAFIAACSLAGALVSALLAERTAEALYGAVALASIAMTLAVLAGCLVGKADLWQVPLVLIFAPLHTAPLAIGFSYASYTLLGLIRHSSTAEGKTE